MQSAPRPAASYELLFDLGQQAYLEGVLVWLLLGSAMLLPAAWLRRRRRQQGGATAMPSFMMVFGGVAMACGGIMLWDYHRLLGHLQAGRVEIAEGQLLSHSVEQIASYDSQSKRYRRSEWEAFLVGSIAFGFTRDGSAVGFRNSTEPRLQLRDGEWLRVHYVEDVAGDFLQRRILRLERAKPSISHQES